MTLLLLSGALAGCGSTDHTVAPPVATTMAAQTSTTIAGTTGGVVNPAPAVSVLDADGHPMSGATVTFAVSSGGGAVTGATQTTDASGAATVGSWTLGTTTGSNTLTATTGALTPVTFTATASAGAAASLAKAAGDNTSAPAGTALSVSPSVVVKDAYGNPVLGVAVTFAVATGGGSASAVMQSTNSQGVATLGGWTLGAKVGANTLIATAGALGAVTFTATGIVGPAAVVTKTAGDAQTAFVGSAVAVAPSVSVTDAFSNPVPGVSVTFAVDSGRGTITGAIQTTNSAGVATVGEWRLGPTTGANTLVATAGSLSPVTFRADGKALAGGPATTVTFAYCQGAPLWFGYQDAGGSWTQVTPGANGTYSFAVHSRGAVAQVFNDGYSGRGYATDFTYGTASELQFAADKDCRFASTGTKTVNGTVAGVDLHAQVRVMLGHGGGGPDVDSTSFTLRRVEAGPHDLFATMVPFNSPTGNSTKLIVRRAINPAAGSTLAPLNFASAEAVRPLIRGITVTGATSGANVTGYFSFVSANGTTISTGNMAGPTGSGTYGGIAPVPGDLNDFYIFSTDSRGDRGLEAFYNAATDHAFALGLPLTAATVSTVASAPYPQLRAQFASQAVYNAYGNVFYTQGSSANAAAVRMVSVTVTAGYLGATSTTWDLVIPDLTGAAGFNTSWMLASGSATSVKTEAFGGASVFAAPTDGAISYWANTTGAVSILASRGPLQVRRTLPADILDSRNQSSRALWRRKAEAARSNRGPSVLR